MKLVVQLLYRLKRLIKILLLVSITLIVLSTLGLIFFVNFYSYSSLTRFVYSIEWLIAYTPLAAPDGGILIPPAMSIAFHHLHALKMAYTRFATKYLHNDNYPDFDGKYHWSRGELEACREWEFEMLQGREKDPELLCHVDPTLLRFLRTEVLSVDPPIVKYHSLLTPSMVEGFVQESQQLELRPSKILVRDSLDADIWQDSLVVNGTFLNHYALPTPKRVFLDLQKRITAFNLLKSEQYHLKKYLPGGHYAPHLDYLIINPDEANGNRIATFMIILHPADIGGGTVFPTAGVNFRPKAGDAVLWVNQQPDYSVAQGSFHGACPVLAGEKFGATLWIRSVGQELRFPCPLERGKPYDYKHLTHPDFKRPTKFWTYRECPWLPEKRCPNARAKSNFVT